HADFVEIVRAVYRSVDAEAREAEVGFDVRHGLVAERKHRRRIDDRGGEPVLHLENVDAVGVIKAAMEELELKRQTLAAPERLLRLKADYAVAVVGQVLQLIRQLVVRRLVGLARKVARPGPHHRRLEDHALILRQGFAPHRIPDQRAVEGPAGKRQRETGSKKITAAQRLLLLR